MKELEKLLKELEILLNTLIKKGWKPRWYSYDRFEVSCWELCLIYKWRFSGGLQNLRELVSIESGLWQFVCSKKLLSDKIDMKDYIEDSYWFQNRPYDKDGFYWVMKCARLEEEELGKFLVENIKV